MATGGRFEDEAAGLLPEPGEDMIFSHPEKTVDFVWESELQI